MPKAWRHTILCIHGAGGNSLHWGQQLIMAKEWNCRILAVDLPGHGKSTGLPMSRIEDYSLFIKDFLSLLGIRCFSLAGHSMGGAIAIDFALTKAPVPEFLILIGTNAKFKVAHWLLQSLEEGSMPPNFIRMAYHKKTNSSLIALAQKEASEIPVSVYLNDFQACQAFDLTDKIPELNIPCFLLFGSEDRLTPPKEAEILKFLPNNLFSVIPEAGHMVMIEKPQEVNTMIGKFIKD